MDDNPREETLDPQNWDDLRALAHRMVDDMLDYQKNVRQRSVWQAIPSESKAQLDQPVPRAPQERSAIYEAFKTHVLPYPIGNIHPRFWGWVIGTGTPLGMLAEMLAAGMNPNLGGGEHAANYVEAQVLNWFKELLGFPRAAGGLLASGGSMANLIGLTVARNARAEVALREVGLQGAPRRMVLYASEQVHNSVHKAVMALGLGLESLRLIPTNDAYAIDLDALEAQIKRDRADGLHPFCVVGNAGTVNTGAFDDLNALAEVAAREGLWYHVDGAFGALAALAPDLKPLTAGMERADSLAFDLHKWMYMPIEVGCVLVRDAEAQHSSYLAAAGYLAHGERGIAGGPHWFGEYGPQLSRGFRALKVWMGLKEHGVEKYGRLIQQNVDQCRYLVQLIERSPNLELVAPAPLNVVCFRYVRDGLSADALNALNEELLNQLQESGVAAPSYATLQDRYALRVANVNHRTRREDFSVLVEEVVRFGNSA